MLLWWSFYRFYFLFVFVLFETNTKNEVCVRERHFYWWARDREVAREPESECRALLPCPMAHARRHARAVSRARATAARTAKSFRALPLRLLPPARLARSATFRVCRRHGRAAARRETHFLSLSTLECAESAAPAPVNPMHAWAVTWRAFRLSTPKARPLVS